MREKIVKLKDFPEDGSEKEHVPIEPERRRFGMVPQGSDGSAIRRSCLEERIVNRV